jgi:predicted aspartyl protease
MLAGCVATGFGMLAPRLVAAVTGPGAPAAGAAVAAADEPLFAAPTRLDRVGRVLAPVRIDGQGPFRFIVDTGATRSAVSATVVAALGLVVGSGESVRMQGVTGEAVVPTTRVGRLEAGSMVLRDHDLPVLPPTVLARADGILGVEGMTGQRLDIDFMGDRVVIARSRDQAAAPGVLVVPVERRRGLLLARARVGHVRCRAIIDTGAERTLGNPELRRRLGMREGADAGSSMRVFGTTDDVQDGELRIAPSIRIGDAELRQLPITFADLHVFRVWKLDRVPAMVIGMDLLGVVARLVVDYRRGELQIEHRRA